MTNDFAVLILFCLSSLKATTAPPPGWRELGGEAFRWRSFLTGSADTVPHILPKPAFLSYAIATRAPGAQTLDVINNFGYNEQLWI